MEKNIISILASMGYTHIDKKLDDKINEYVYELKFADSSLFLNVSTFPDKPYCIFDFFIPYNDQFSESELNAFLAFLAKSCFILNFPGGPILDKNEIFITSNVIVPKNEEFDEQIIISFIEDLFKKINIIYQKATVYNLATNIIENESFGVDIKNLLALIDKLNCEFTVDYSENGNIVKISFLTKGLKKPENLYSASVILSPSYLVFLIGLDVTILPQNLQIACAKVNEISDNYPGKFHIKKDFTIVSQTMYLDLNTKISLPLFQKILHDLLNFAEAILEILPIEKDRTLKVKQSRDDFLNFFGNFCNN